MRLTPNQAQLAVAAIDFALGMWDKAPENDALTAVFDELFKAAHTPSHAAVLNVWSTEHGECIDCGNPAAYAALDAYGPNPDRILRDEMKLCSICAARWAVVDGERLVYLFDYVFAPATNPEVHDGE